MASIVLSDADSGEVVGVDYLKNRELRTDSAGNLVGVRLTIPRGTELPARVRAQVIADVFPLSDEVFDAAGGGAAPAPGSPSDTGRPAERGTGRGPADPAGGARGTGSSGLPFTGLALGALLAIGLALLGAGAAVRSRSRRRGG